MGQRSIQIQVRRRERCSKLPADPCCRIRHTDVDTRGDEASKGKPLRGPATCADGEDRTERESSIGGGSTSRIQDIQLNERTNGVFGHLPCLGEQRGCLPWQQHKREKICRAGVFWHPERTKLHSSFAMGLPSLRLCFSIASRPVLWSHCLPLSSQNGFDFFLINAATSSHL